MNWESIKILVQVSSTGTMLIAVIFWALLGSPWRLSVREHACALAAIMFAGLSWGFIALIALRPINWHGFLAFSLIFIAAAWLADRRGWGVRITAFTAFSE